MLSGGQRKAKRDVKIIFKDFKKGEVKVRIDDNEDLWTLRSIITEGDEVSGHTTRLIKKEETEGRRKPVYLKILVEKVEFMESSFTLKALGKIIEGPDDVPRGSYHSFNLEPGSEITIKKEWNEYDKRALKKSETKPMKILVTILDTQEATHALITNEVKELYTHEARLTRKDAPDYTKKVNDYYNEVKKQINELNKNHKPERIIIAGPGYAPQELAKIMDLKTIIEHTNQTGMNGVKELINKGVIDKITRENEVSSETHAVEEFFTQLSKDKLIKYGLEAVTESIKRGAVKKLLISEELIINLRERKRFKELENIINMAEKTKAEIEFISAKHDAGRRFNKLNGIGAILRYEI